MIFSLEALQALHGDSLIVHYGRTDAPRFIVIDGGPESVFTDTLQPRLDAIKAKHHPGEPLPIQLLMVSHIDDDHVHGVLDLAEHLVDLEDADEEKPYRILRLWHNSFDELLGNGDDEIFSELGASATAASVAALVPAGTVLEAGVAAVVASVGQGRELRRHAKRLNLLPANRPFKGLVMAPASGGKAFEFAPRHGLRMRVLNPDERRVRSLHAKWEAELRKAKKKKTAALAAAFTDRSVFNLSSIVVLLELDGATMLLTGDARGDDILAGLDAAKLLKRDRIELDLLKLPHHGSDRNVSTDFFRRVRAKHYVASANGEHDNPDIATLKMLSEARDDDKFTLHLTNRTGKKGIGPKLRAFFASETNAGRKYRVRFREDDEPSVIVDLRDRVRY
jgi:hypothetical protein